MSRPSPAESPPTEPIEATVDPAAPSAEATRGEAAVPIEAASVEVAAAAESAHVPAPEAGPAEAAPRPTTGWMHHDCRKGYQVGLGTSEPSWLGKAKAWLWQLELPCVAVYRLGQLARELRGRNQFLGMALLLVYAPLQFLVRVLLQVDISPRCVIGPGLHLGHPYTIIIGPTTIGANCSLTHNVTIGMGLSAERRGIPTLGDDVWIGPNAVLTGPIHIGDGATVAAGSVVSRDVPPGALVMGNPARIVLASYDNSALLDYEVR